MNRGLIQLILIIVIAVVVLGYFGFNIRSIVESPAVQENLGFLWGLTRTLWSNYLSQPFGWFWDNIGRPVWDVFVENLMRFRAGESSTFQENAPGVGF